ncbi:hypothetical protein C1M55_21290 [Rhodococcus qingshengii]|uniref:hypothetical protein n=1 Tax=Rhodococcus TaxID=1827 RepID=UPI0009784141|nr:MULTISPECIES: hypothetical protein [Rhodococcus]AUS33374.1 hypothetical protein C1M55_21290 [Rhodococcus qingshengii]MCC4305783.1 hypothetical protein [Rhodococcus sp. 3-2]OMQ38041.1 hypothetical protein BK799_01195 [Rhodococcus sp. D-1]
MARLISSVHVADESGVSHVFGPTDAIPSWAAARITNPAAWDGPPPEPEVTEPVGVETETATESETVAEEVVPESAPESESVPATEEEPTPDLVAESVPEPETVEPEPAVPAPKRRGRPAKAVTNN